MLPVLTCSTVGGGLSPAPHAGKLRHTETVSHSGPRKCAGSAQPQASLWQSRPRPLPCEGAGRSAVTLMAGPLVTRDRTPAARGDSEGPSVRLLAAAHGVSGNALQMACNRDAGWSWACARWQGQWWRSMAWGWQSRLRCERPGLETKGCTRCASP